MSEEANEIYRGGRPTDSDVQKLISVFGIPKEGRFISYEEIQKAINISPEENRWYSVTNAWRKKLFDENNLEFDAVKNSFKCLTAMERISKSCRLLIKAVRASGKAATLALKTETKKLTHEGRILKDFTVNTHVSLKNQYLIESQKLSEIPDMNIKKLMDVAR